LKNNRKGGCRRFTYFHLKEFGAFIKGKNKSVFASRKEAPTPKNLGEDVGNSRTESHQI